MNGADGYRATKIGKPGGRTSGSERVKITEDVRKYATEQEISEEQALQTGLEEEANEFIELTRRCNTDTLRKNHMAPPKKTSKAKREAQLAQLNAAIATLSEKANESKSTQKKLDLLESVSLGLYEELDKLAKKAGAEEVTELVLEQVNDVIRESRELAADDPYVQRYHEFVAAGNNPQHRDVVVVLRQIRQGLERFAVGLKMTSSRYRALLDDAKGVRIAVMLSLQDVEEIAEGNFSANEVSVQPRWMRGYRFSFDVLDRTDIPTYFSAE